MTRISNWKLWNQLFLLLALLNILDYISTHLIMAVAGYDVEANPLMRWVTVYFDTPVAMLVVKAIFIALAWWWVDLRLKMKEARPQVATYALTFLLGVYTAVVSMNFYMYFAT